MPSTEKLTKWREVATIVALLAVPPVVAYMQTQATNRSVNQQYVALAISILQKPSPDAKDDNDTALRSWAVELIDSTAPIKLSQQLRLKLGTGHLYLSGFDFQQWDDFSRKDLEQAIKNAKEKSRSTDKADGAK